MAGLFESLTVFSFCSALSAFLLCGTENTMRAWTPKEIWSVVLWVYFAVLTHLKFIPAGEGWPRWGRRLEMGATAAGYFVMLATFLGVSLLLRSSHSF
jgi:ABC-type transport system involved in cytochrome c biogenesis permease subunit